MIRSTIYALLGLVSVVVMGTLPLACQSGGVGDPCTPEDEYDPQFAGFKVAEENLESRSFQCETRICLVNHFQGRVSCPLGQTGPSGMGLTSCSPNEDPTGCNTGEDCVISSISVPACTTDTDCQEYGNHCNPNGNFCECQSDTDCINLSGGMFSCDAVSTHATYHQCVSYLCHVKNNCQTLTGTPAENCSVALVGGVCPQGKERDCCVPGTDTPVSPPVCGQCDANSNRDATQAVYCSCRCGVADTDPPEPNFNFCSCPTGYSCVELVPDVGLGDAELTGKYCIKTGSDYKGTTDCGNVVGAFPPSSDCQGQQAP
jgi:hypothetical protein